MPLMYIDEIKDRMDMTADWLRSGKKPITVDQYKNGLLEADIWYHDTEYYQGVPGGTLFIENESLGMYIELEMDNDHVLDSHDVSFIVADDGYILSDDDTEEIQDYLFEMVPILRVLEITTIVAAMKKL